MSAELLPVLSGVLLGTILGRLYPGVGKGICLALVLLLAFVATVASGEFRLNWGFIFVDIPMVAVPAYAGFFVVRKRGWLH